MIAISAGVVAVAVAVLVIIIVAARQGSATQRAVQEAWFLPDNADEDAGVVTANPAFVTANHHDISV